MLARMHRRLLHPTGNSRPYIFVLHPGGTFCQTPYIVGHDIRTIRTAPTKFPPVLSLVGIAPFRICGGNSRFSY